MPGFIVRNQEEKPNVVKFDERVTSYDRSFE
jgi:hypothetical protein